MLLALDAIFGLFVVLQAAYLFGGLDTLALSGMTYSEYARRGFFELVAVAVLSGVVVLALDAIVVERSREFRLAAAGLVALTGVVLLSAIVRLGLYQQAYGWTELRFFTLAGISWLAVGVVATLAGVLLERAAWVPRVMVGAGLIIALAVNAIGHRRSWPARTWLGPLIPPSSPPTANPDSTCTIWAHSVTTSCRCSWRLCRGCPNGRRGWWPSCCAVGPTSWRPSTCGWAGHPGVWPATAQWKRCALPGMSHFADRQAYRAGSSVEAGTGLPQPASSSITVSRWQHTLVGSFLE